MEKKEYFKIIGRCAAFAVLFAMLFSYLTDLLVYPHEEADEIHAFYGEPENTIDVLYVGSSPLLRGISPLLMWQEYGFTGYVRASALQAPAVSYGILEESLEYQSPELVVLLFDNIFLEYDYAEREGDLRRGLDGMKLSKQKLAIAQEVTQADERQSLISYAFSLLRYHDRWKEIDWTERELHPKSEHSTKKGNLYLREITPQSYPENFMEPTGEAAPAFDADAQAYIEKSLALCAEKEIPVLLLHLPKMSWTYEQSMAMEAFAAENGAAYLDLDRAEYRSQLDLDPAVDFYDQGHLNLTGVEKVSKWLGAWLDAQYALPDHRDEPIIGESWNTDWMRYAEKAGLPIGE